MLKNIIYIYSPPKLFSSEHKQAGQLLQLAQRAKRVILQVLQVFTLKNKCNDFAVSIKSGDSYFIVN